jgi:hypothetical protein
MIYLSKFVVMNFCGFIVGVRSLFFCRKISQPNALARNAYGSGPSFVSTLRKYPLETTSVPAEHSSVCAIFLMRAQTKITLSIVEAVEVFVVNFLFFIGAKYFSVHSYFFARLAIIPRGAADRVGCVCVTMDFPIPFREPLKIFGVNGGILSHRKRNKTVGWIERLDNLVSLHGAFHRCTSHALSSAAF